MELQVGISVRRDSIIISIESSNGQFHNICFSIQMELVELLKKKNEGKKKMFYAYFNYAHYSFRYVIIVVVRMLH
jgi:hypothetical protein